MVVTHGFSLRNSNVALPEKLPEYVLIAFACLLIGYGTGAVLTARKNTLTPCGPTHPLLLHVTCRIGRVWGSEGLSSEIGVSSEVGMR